MTKDNTALIGSVRATTEAVKKYVDEAMDDITSAMNAANSPEVQRKLANEVLAPYLAIQCESQLGGVSAEEHRRFTAWVVAAVLFECSVATCGPDSDAAGLASSAADMLQIAVDDLNGMVKDRIAQLGVQ